MAKRYNRIILGQKHKYAEECRKDGYIGVNFDIKEDLAVNLNTDWTEFSKHYIPVFLKAHPEKSNGSAGVSCGFLYTFCSRLQKGDIILSPNEKGEYYVGEIEGNYYYKANTVLCHRRRVKWYDKTISYESMSDALQHSVHSIGTCCDITKYATEIENLINSNTIQITSSDPDVVNPSEFAMEKHLEDFLVKNWNNLPISQDYDILEDNTGLIGQQYPTETGPIDLLAQSKDKKTYLVIELKRGQASDKVVGQIQRYMGYIQDIICTGDQSVRGIIIALEADKNLQFALKVCPTIDFYHYCIDFKLVKGY